MSVERFCIDTNLAALADLKTRLGLTRWNDAITDDWSYSTARTFLQGLIEHRRDVYNSRQREAELNRLPHIRSKIDGFGVHLLHYKSRVPNALPLLLRNGWPSSFVEYQRLAPRLSGPAAFDGEIREAFEVPELYAADLQSFFGTLRS